MDLAKRKYNLIREFVKVDKESVIEALELVLKQEKEAQEEISIVNAKELDQRLESYQNNPDELVDWENVKKDW